MPLSYLATFNLNTYKYSGLTLAKDKGGPQAVSFYCKIKVEQEVKQSMIFFFNLEKNCRNFWFANKICHIFMTAQCFEGYFSSPTIKR